MKNKKLLSIISACLFLCMLLTSCIQYGKPEKYSAHSFDYFDTASIITGYADSQQEFDEIADVILNQLSEYHKLYSIYHRFEGMENMCTVNELVDGEHRTVTVDRRIIDMLLYARQMYDLTDGKLNIAMGSVLSLWHNYRAIGKDDPDNASLPPADKLEEAAKHTDITNMIIDEENNTVTLTDPQMTLDVGAVAKGYAVECIAQYLEEQGIGGYILNIGGNVRAVGTRADSEDWTVGVENAKGDDYLAYLKLSNASVVTSGSYQRFYIVDGVSYHHIIHPDTNMPATGYRSVSVVCKDSGLGDSLSTALFCMSQTEGESLIESLSDVEVMWVTEDGEKLCSSGWQNFVKE